MTDIKIQFRTISSGPANEDDNTDVWKVEDETVDTSEIILKEDGTVGLPIIKHPADGTYSKNGKSYQFAFWTAEVGDAGLPKFPSTDPLLSIAKSDVKDLTKDGKATAWYFQTGGNGPPGHAVRVRTFDTDLNNFRKETSISKAAPANAWGGPNNHSVSTQAGAVTVTLEGQLKFPAPAAAQPPNTPAKLFKDWLLLGNAALHTQPSVPCTKDESALGISFYGADPDPAKVSVPGKNLVATDVWVLLWISIFGPEVPGGPIHDAPHNPKVVVGTREFQEFMAAGERSLKTMPVRQQQAAIGQINRLAQAKGH